MKVSGKHIAFVIGKMDRGGAERVISILANRYADDGWNVDIIMLLKNVVQYDLDQRIRLHDMTGKNCSNILNMPGWLIHFRNYVKKERPDVIVSFVARINILVLIATFGLKSNIIVSERNDPIKDGRSGIVNVLVSILYPGAKKVVFQTERAKGYFSRKIQNKGIVITNPIKIYKTADTEAKKKIVSVGRLAPQKNHKMLIKVFAEIVEIYPEYQLWIYGEGKLRNELEKMIQDLEMQEHVFLPGNVSNVHEKIADAEIFVLCSDYEGLSNALLEAMMMGISCVSTDCAGSDEYIVDGYNGMLVPVGNSEKLKSAIIKMIKDEKTRKMIAQNGKESVQKCCSESVLMKWKQVIEEEEGSLR